MFAFAVHGPIVRLCRVTPPLAELPFQQLLCVCVCDVPWQF